MHTGTPRFHFLSEGGISSKAVLFTPERNQLVTYGNNVTRLQDITGESKQIANNAHLFAMALTADGRILYGSSNNGIVQAYTLYTEDTIALARSRVTRPLTEAECLAYLHLKRCPVEGSE
jgi:hypothetical protein